MILTFDISCNYIDVKKWHFASIITTINIKSQIPTSIITTTDVQNLKKYEFLHYFVTNMMVKWTKIKNLNDQICDMLKVGW